MTPTCTLSPNTEVLLPDPMPSHPHPVSEGLWEDPNRHRGHSEGCMYSVHELSEAAVPVISREYCEMLIAMHGWSDSIKQVLSLEGCTKRAEAAKGRRHFGQLYRQSTTLYKKGPEAGLKA